MVEFCGGEGRSGGGGVGGCRCGKRPFRSLGYSTNAPTKGSPLVLFFGIHFLSTNRKSSLEASLAPMHTDLETGGERQKCKILVKIFVKVQKNLKNFGQNRNFVVYCSSRKTNLVDVTKKQ